VQQPSHYSVDVGCDCKVKVRSCHTRSSIQFFPTHLSAGVGAEAHREPPMELFAAFIGGATALGTVCWACIFALRCGGMYAGLVAAELLGAPSPAWTEPPRPRLFILAVSSAMIDCTGIYCRNRSGVC